MQKRIHFDDFIKSYANEKNKDISSIRRIFLIELTLVAREVKHEMFRVQPVSLENNDYRMGMLHFAELMLYKVEKDFYKK